MELGTIGKTTATYQGSGLENNAGPKMPSEARTTAESKATVDVKDSVDTTDSSRKQSDTEAALEIQEAKRNDSVKRAVEQINKKAKNSEAIFGIHDETNRVTIKIVDKETREVLKEFPPEETLDMIAKVWELAGLMVDEKR